MSVGLLCVKTQNESQFRESEEQVKVKGQVLRAGTLIAGTVTAKA